MEDLNTTESLAKDMVDFFAEFSEIEPRITAQMKDQSDYQSYQWGLIL